MDISDCKVAITTEKKSIWRVKRYVKYSYLKYVFTGELFFWVGGKGVKAEGLALAVPLRALPETPAECQGCLEEASRPEVLWEVQWGHPVVRFQGLP